MSEASSEFHSQPRLVTRRAAHGPSRVRGSTPRSPSTILCTRSIRRWWTCAFP